MNAQQHVTILVIDDDVAIVEMLQMALEEEGFLILTASDGEAGLQKLAQHKANLILCDVMMPVLDGREFCRIIASSPEYKDIPVVLMSAGRLEIDCNSYPHAAFLSKPFNFTRLLEVVYHYTGGPGIQELHKSNAA
jgi:CheY-like chemotaxis protein